MEPVSLFLISLWKFFAVVGVLGVAVAGITTGVVKGINHRRMKNDVSADKGVVGNKGRQSEKISKLYKDTNRLISTPHAEEVKAGEVKVEKAASTMETSLNQEKFVSGGGILSSIQNPRLLKIVQDYANKAKIDEKTSFSKLEITYVGEPTKKKEVLVAPKDFVEQIFYAKVCYECAVSDGQKYPVTIKCQDVDRRGVAIGKESNLTVLDTREEAANLALESLATFTPKLAQMLDMNSDKLSELGDRNQGPSQ